MSLFKREIKYVLDSSSIVDGRMVYLFERKFFEGRIVIPFAVKSIARKYIGEDIDRLIGILKKHASVEFVGGAVEGLAEEELVLKIATKKKARVITTSDELCRQAKLFPAVRVIDVRELYRILMPIFPPRKLISVRILKKGKNPNEGVGYIEGVKVVVEDGARYLNQTVNAQVQAMISSDAGNLVLCTLVRHGEERSAPDSDIIRRDYREQSSRPSYQPHSYHGTGPDRREPRDRADGAPPRREDHYHGGHQPRREHRYHSGSGRRDPRHQPNVSSPPRETRTGEESTPPGK